MRFYQEMVEGIQKSGGIIMNWISAGIIIAAFLLGLFAGLVITTLSAKEEMRSMYHLGYELGREEERQRREN